ncbi:hypothetical protein BpHYR1_014953 [Brachionus plicatilis]|uniref:Uncharacterized protein n=1 Tax=Brachionus plicatilis TaxID=10195 RepID=A0A3M7Q0E0_BRAPC|nr:hypothetical protein BpHYR1_014953 [Brachionus plicatilis]
MKSIFYFISGEKKGFNLTPDDEEIKLFIRFLMIYLLLFHFVLAHECSKLFYAPVLWFQEY